MGGGGKIMGCVMVSASLRAGSPCCLVWLASASVSDPSCVSPAQALQCHECSGENCYWPKSCPDTSRYCLTSWYSEYLGPR